MEHRQILVRLLALLAPPALNLFPSFLLTELQYRERLVVQAWHDFSARHGMAWQAHTLGSLPFTVLP
jgi:hypothetical protein